MRSLLGWSAVAACLGLASIIWLGNDSWWPTFILLYGPRWIWLGLLFLVLPGWRNRRRASLQCVVTAAVLAFGVLGVRIGKIQRPPTPGRLVRVITLNSEGRPDAIQEGVKLALQEDVKIIVMQECPPSAETTVQLPDGWQSRQSGEVCLFSALSIEGEITLMERDTKTIGWKGSIAKAHLSGPSGRLTLGIVHLRSVHSTLQEFLDFSTFFTHDSTVRREAMRRETGSAAAAAWFAVRDDPADVVMGDFNLPPESHIFRRHWSGWRDAFDIVGWGTGYTWYSKWHGLRIDHILVSRAITVTKSFVGADVGSVHRPVFAELSFPAAQRTSSAR